MSTISTIYTHPDGGDTFEVRFQELTYPTLKLVSVNENGSEKVVFTTFLDDTLIVGNPETIESLIVMADSLDEAADGIRRRAARLMEAVNADIATGVDS